MLITMNHSCSPFQTALSIQRYTFSSVQFPFDNNICKKDYFIILRADYHESFLFPFQAAFHLQIQVTLQISTDKGNKLRHCLDKKYTLGLLIFFGFTIYKLSNSVFKVIQSESLSWKDCCRKCILCGAEDVKKQPVL